MINPLKDLALIQKTQLLEKKELILLAYGLYKVAEKDGKFGKADYDRLLEETKKAAKLMP